MQPNQKEIDWLLKEKYEGVESEAFHMDLARLRAGEPLAYIIGHVPFLETKIYLDSLPLIPRAETEFWTEKLITDVKERFAGNEIKILDLCAGSGCIGISLLRYVPGALVDFVEIDVRHHKTIRKNITENEIDISRACIYDGSLYKKIEGTYDVIVANPPYIDPHNDMSEASVRLYEPHNALYGGKSGMELIQKIITGADLHLSKKGMLYIEHEPGQEKEIHEVAEKNKFFPSTHRDQFEIERYTVLTRKAD